ncbi:hypothetical protein BT63DRAFT_483227 [Microthyrium microscopicum]|uniref:Asl1-like glycosyl hydrolase catalytic domain-containing protein n=1 Tax=Microthyrium microscopicum TaxID=703497 RepID=A0A6A6U0R7_9PEZI|nr:hypothetical protein BT63DRAFT_483227 [Microthyrium microscopicum]
MHLPTTLLLLCQSHLTHATPPKRGLVYIGSKTSPTDDKTWASKNTDLTWYYNFGSNPTPSLSNTKYEYVPMLWGAPTTSPSSGTFYNTVKGLKDGGMNITHVLGFNEPDGATSTGGSAISASDAAKIWISEMQPLRSLGVKLGAPATVGSGAGILWLQAFFKACGGNCDVDFFPIHWYGGFGGLAGYVGSMRATFGNGSGNVKWWVTEFAYPQGSVGDAGAFLNESLKWLDGQADVERYSYFGTYRTSVSNWVGPGAAMLDGEGRLTDIGGLYLGTRDVGTGGAMGMKSLSWGLLVLVVLPLLV